ncbi:hypothetical protein F2Q70_00009859 [Brassica cretica]|uniref:Uncharacterized protein n=1 Tax=Brassica cretica TaxID=69181 RepID=A0A8S9MER0_BRACR|nr:hypothetical protein F2Q70_00009859 [Brassica cretica]
MGFHASASSLQTRNHLWRMAPIQSSDKAFGDRRRRRSKKNLFDGKRKVPTPARTLTRRPYAGSDLRSPLSLFLSLFAF